jgi:hypothetical protein
VRGQDRLRPVLSHLKPRLDLTKVGGVPRLRYDLVVPDTPPTDCPERQRPLRQQPKEDRCEIKRHAILDMILLLIAIGAMSTARYW